jgi:glutathione S-transferase
VPLYPSTAQGEAEAWRWSLWAQGHLEPWVQRDALLAGLRAVTSHHVQAAVRAALARLDGALAGRAWLTGDHFTVCDLNVAAVLSPSRARHLDLVPYEQVKDWLECCYGRPAAVATRQRFQR